jgi:hypothetical protein
MTPGIDSKHAAEEEAGEDDDGQRADADDVGLHENVGAVRRLAKDVADGAAGGRVGDGVCGVRDRMRRYSGAKAHALLPL